MVALDPRAVSCNDPHQANNFLYTSDRATGRITSLKIADFGHAGTEDDRRDCRCALGHGARRPSPNARLSPGGRASARADPGRR